MTLIIDPEFKDLIPPLSDEEYSLLEESIVEEGVRDPIVTWNGIIVDGHNRYRIATHNDIPFKTMEITFIDRDAAKEWMYKAQLGRRNLRLEVAAYLIGKMYETRKQEHGGTGANQYNVQSAHFEHSAPEKTANVIAKETGRGQATVRRAGEYALAVDALEKTAPGARNKILTGETKLTRDEVITIAAMPEEKRAPIVENVIERAADMVKASVRDYKKEERNADLLNQKTAIETGTVILPTGVFEVISMDPPWPYGTQYDPNGRRSANPYPEMSLEEIGAIDLPSSDNCVLFLWTTHKFMRESFKLLDGWGFRDVAIITWVKDRMGLGSWLRSQSEFCIMAVKGSPKVILTNQTTVLNGIMREHSRKPEEFYDMVDGLCIGRKLDYFSRETRQGWSSIGNEPSKFNEVP